MPFPEPEASSLLNTEGVSSAKERALILVVERNPAVQRLEKFFLEQAGYTVEFAPDGVVALERARELKPKFAGTPPKRTSSKPGIPVDITCLMTYELSDLFEVHGISNQEVSNMSDNILLLRLTDESKMERTVRVVKTRGSAHDNHEHTLQITNRGLVVKRS